MSFAAVTRMAGRVNQGGCCPMKAPLTVRIIDDVHAWDAIRADWDALCQVSPTMSTALDFTWLRHWWNTYGPAYGAAGLRIVTLWREVQMVGALPLYIAHGQGGIAAARCLRFISTGEAEFEETCTDYLNLLHLPGEGDACAPAAWAAVAAMNWDTLQLLDIPADSPLLLWREMLPRRGRFRLASRGSCPIARIEGGFEAYLDRLSTKSRGRARRELRKAVQAGAVFELASAADAGAYYDDLIRIHQARWTAIGQPGCFAVPRFTAFHRILVGEWVASGRVVLARLTYRGQACAVVYGFQTGDKFDLYQQGVRPVDDDAIHSPGMVANLLLMTRLAERGVARYDLLRGVTPFKRLLMTEQCPLTALECRRMTVRALLEAMVHQCRLVLRKVSRMLLRC